jgi:monoterpene epsilon-lactone hydrolase
MRTERLRYPLKSSLTGSLLLLVSVVGFAQHRDNARPPTAVGADGTVRVSGGTIPLSAYMSDEAKGAFTRIYGAAPDPAIDWDRMSADEQRAYADHENRGRIERAKALYPVTISEERIAGVNVEIVQPAQRAKSHNRDRILINLHGGSYSYASGGLGRLLDAIPIAGHGSIEVISVDYRLLPRYRFPAPVEDVIAVYKELLKSYKPQNIGIYGCSTGAALTAVAIAWFQKENLPLPGAIGLFCEGAIKDDQIEGDSYFVGRALTSGTIPNNAYPPNRLMLGTDPTDPLVAPVASLKVLSKFPATLLLSGTRDLGLSGVLYTHARLVKAGAEAELHVWDGMWHGFFADPDLPESKDAYEVIVRFFDRHLGAR